MTNTSLTCRKWVSKHSSGILFYLEPQYHLLVSFRYGRKTPKTKQKKPPPYTALYVHSIITTQYYDCKVANTCPEMITIDFVSFKPENLSVSRRQTNWLFSCFFPKSYWKSKWSPIVEQLKFWIVRRIYFLGNILHICHYKCMWLIIMHTLYSADPWEELHFPTSW